MGSQAEYSVGGLVGYVKSGGTLLASYAAGAVTYRRATGYWDEQGRRYAGGLVGRVGGKVYASYAWGNVTASENYRATTNFGYTAAGGLVGVLDSGGTIRAAYATGDVAPPAGTILTAYRTNYAGKALGKNDGGTFTAVYGSGTVTSNQTVTAPTGSDKTETELKTPTDNDTPANNIYSTWDDHDIDNADNDDDATTGTDDPWAFGTSSQLPVLNFTPSGGTVTPPTDQQPVSITLTAASTTVTEGSTTTITTPTLSGTRNYDVRIQNPSQSRYTYDFTITKGNTTPSPTSPTFSAVTNTAEDGDVDADLTDAVVTPANSVTISSSSSTIAIQDDEIHDVTGLAVTAAKQSDNTYDITVTWGAPNAVNSRNAAGTDGYDLQYCTSGCQTDSNWTTVSTDIPIATVTHTLDSVTVYRTYDIRIRAKSSSKNGDWSSTVSVEVGEDFDEDNDGYIEVSDLAELNAIRYDLNADGAVSSTDETNYLAAFENAMPSMGCPSTGCVGYELRANLDLNVSPYNTGTGWTPIGGTSGGIYSGEFDGNSDTEASGDGGPYTISNLFIDGTTGNYAGLFAYIYSGNQSIEDVALENVDVTLNVSTNDHVYVGGLAGRVGGGVEIEDSYTTGRVRAGQSASEPVTFTVASKDAFVGGLLGEANTSPIVGSYSTADVTSHVTSTQSSPTAKVGGLAGTIVGTSSNNNYVVAASYAAGDVVASAVGTSSPGAYAGGLIGDDSSTNGIKSSYARGDVSATNSSAGALVAGGLVGLLSGNIITGSYATGAVTTTGTKTIGGAGGLVGFSSGSAVNSYWDTDTSGITTTGTNQVGVGKTTTELQSPTQSGGYAGIYANNWNLNLDGQTGNDDPWHFGTANQYPTLKYGSHDEDDQRAVVTLSASPTTIWESNVGGSTRATSTTITATLDTAWNEDVVVTLPVNTAKYTTSDATITVDAGDTSADATLTAVNNYVDAASATVTLTQAAHPADTKWISKGTDASITINDDDELAKPSGVKLSVDGSKIRVDWNQVTGATGYKVQYNSTSATDWSSYTEETISSGSTTNHSFTSGLTAGTRYYFRVLPTKTGADEPPSDVKDIQTHGTSPVTVDYDDDNDGLIEVSSVAQLNAIRYDLNGDGVPTGTSTEITAYNTAFPNAEDNMGCNESVVTIAALTGNAPCDGYELRANLDLNTSPYNTGTGWTPIGGATAYSGDFDGNNDSDSTGDGGSYKISNLFIAATSGQYIGLFGHVGGGGTIQNVTLEKVNVTRTGTSATDVDIGALAGRADAAVEDSRSTGQVRAGYDSTNKITLSAAKGVHVGGLVGQSGKANTSDSEIVSSYSTAAVTAYVDGGANAATLRVGGLVGYIHSKVDASYASGDVTTTLTNGGTGSLVHSGGLGGSITAATGAVRASYARGDVSATSNAGSNFGGGLLGFNFTGSSVTASYSLGAVSATGGATRSAGGLVGLSSGTITNSYWDTTTSGIAASNHGTPKTTTELQTPTEYGTGSSIYANWNLNLDGQTGNDNPWNFGTASQYPVLSYGGHVLTKQRNTVTITASPTTIWERADTGLSRVNASTVTATLTNAWEQDVTVTPPAAVSGLYTLSAATISITAGQTRGTVTVTGVDDTTDQTGSPGSRSITLSTTSVDDPAIAVAVTNAAITLNDDDNVAKATAVKLSVDGTKIRADWTAGAGATGYRVEWNTSDSWASIPSTQKADVTGGTTTNYTINPSTALTANTKYYVRVIATKTNELDAPASNVVSVTTHAATPATVDYDLDNDGLIEISNLAQLNAMRWDLDGNGQVASGDQTNYDTAFPNAEDNMGCNESVFTIASNTTGNPDCTGYELRASLDFDTDGDGDVDTNDYVDLNNNNAKDTGEDAIVWNGGAGWNPIGGTAGTSEYTGDFDGNADTSTTDNTDANGEKDGGPYTISNLFINRTSGNYVGLFGKLNAATGRKVQNVALEDVDVTLNLSTASSASVYVGGLAGLSFTDIEDSYVTGRVRAGESASSPVTLTGNVNVYVGGMVGELNASSISGSYSLADVTTNVAGGSSNVSGRAGGLVGYTQATGGTVDASYAAGDVSASVVTTGTPTVIAGGLVGDHSVAGSGSTLRASYARGDVSATISKTGNAMAGGLAGYLATGAVTGSFSTGAATATATTGTITLGAAGGLVGTKGTGTAAASYWDTETSGVSTSSVGTGKTTSELQSPTQSGGYAGIYANWNLNLDGQTGNDDPWDFGSANQYPTLDYGALTAGEQRVVLTLSVTPTTIWERALSAANTPDNTARVNAATVSASLDTAWTEDLVVTLPTNAAYTLSAATITIAAGATTGTATSTLTAVNNLVDAANNAVPLTLGNHPVTTKWASKGTDVTVTINDDDELAKPTGLKASVDGNNIQVNWTRVTNATGYELQYNTTSATAWTSPTKVTISGGATVTRKVTGATQNTTYYFRLLPTKTGADEPPSDVVSTTTTTNVSGTGDYDSDNDGLIEVSNLAQLNAMRWDLDGDGQVDNSTNQTSYDTAFPNAEDNMGCNESHVSIASNNTGNPACTGYELSDNLDFDTGTAGDRTDDTYYNSGAGWTPIGDGTTGYTGEFSGKNGTTQYTITNLHVNLSSTSGTSYAGLFGVIGSGGDVKNVALTKVSVTGSTTGDAVYAGALAGKNSGTVTVSWSLGAVTAKRTGTASDKTAYAGGLVGWNDGTIRASYSRAAVTASSHSANEGYAGGLAGLNDTNDTISASYATGAVTADRGTDTTGAAGNDSHAGGLVALNKGAITASYAVGDGTTDGKNTDMGGLVAENASGATITASYSLGKQTATTGSGGTGNKGGFAGSNSGSIVDSYWDTTSSGIADDADTNSPEGKSSTELKTPTTETGIYANWDVNVDGASGNDDPWDFGTSSQYPALDFTGHVLTKQRNTVSIRVSATTIWERADTGLSRANTSTITATLANAWEDAVVVTPPAAVAGLYTLSSATISIAAGSTTGNVTLTAVDDEVDQTTPDSRSISLTATAVDTPVMNVTFVPTSAESIIVNDDDNVPKTTGVKLTVDGTKMRVDWTAVSGATGYKVQWSTANTTTGWATPTGSETKSGGATVTHTISSGLTANTKYYVRVITVKSGELDAPPSNVVSATVKASAGAGDYDKDNDGLIEITTLAHLNAMRWDLDGDGQADKYDSNDDGDYTDTGEYDYTTQYAAAFPGAEDNMGCNESAFTIASNTTGNPACTGYELRANLDFDTDGDGDVDTNDYVDLDNDNTKDTNEDGIIWNGGLGWDPIGGGATAYTGKFDGNSDTSTTDNTDSAGEKDGGPYTIANLFIDRDATSTGTKYYAGLFGRIDTGAEIKNVKLTGVSVTLENNTTDTTQPNVYSGGLVGHQKAGTITGAVVRGAVKAVVKPVTPNTTATNASNAGGLVGYKEAGDIISSYARVTVTAEQNASAGSLNARAGGLVGHHAAGNVSASYSTGKISSKVSNSNGSAYAGGLVGEHDGGDVKASYSYAETKSSNAGSTNTSVTLYAGGLVAHQDGGNITASYSTGPPTMDKDGATTGVTEYKGGLVGRNSSGTTTNSYWDTGLSGVTATGQGTGKTASQLVSPTGYSGIYANWNLNLDGVTGNDDPWEFGTNKQYPVLDYGLTAADQRVTVTLSASPITIWERALATPSRVNSTTVTATLSEKLVNDVTVTMADTTTDAYNLSSTTITITGGNTTGTTTLTAVNNRVDAANNQVNLATLTTTTSSDPRVGFASATPTFTINDDDSLAAPGNIRTANQTATTFEVQWDRVSGDASYNLQYKLTSASTWTSAPNIPVSGCRVGNDTTKCHYTVTSVAGSRYNVRVEAVASTAGVDNSPYATLIEGAGIDYDKDDDGFIEVSNLDQLNAIRYDLDANGAADSASDNTSYTTAFPSAAPTMGCPVSGCNGYELRANLDFNTDDSTPTADNPTGATSGDDYWNSGNGWDPIGTTAGTSYAGGFDGNMDTDSTGDGGPYTIKNLFQNWTTGNFIGLFAHLNSADDDVWHVALENVDITFDNSAGSGTNSHVYVGALAGHSETDIIRSYTTGVIEVESKITTAQNYTYVGGLVGRLMNAKIQSSYSWVNVDADGRDSTAQTDVYAGGLVGLTGEVPLTNFPDTDVIASWAAGDVAAYAKAGTPDTGTAYAGGLIGAARRGTDIKASYSRGDVSATGATGNIYRGALVGYMAGTTNNNAPSEIEASFATGKLTGTTPTDATLCGLVGDNSDGTITNSYYDSDNLGVTGCDSGHGTGKTTVQLQTPTAYGTGASIYVNWNLDFNNDTNNDDPWDFGTSSQYPVLKYASATNNLTVTDQRPVVNLTLSPAAIYEAVGGATSSTLTATLTADWNEDVTITLPTAADKLTIGGSNQTSGILTFTSGNNGNWDTQQSATVKLAADPGTGKTVVVDFTRLSVSDPEVTPRYLTFTGGSSGNYDTAQTINVKFLAEPTAATTRVSITRNSSNVTTGYKVDLNVYRLAFDLSAATITIDAGDTTGTVTLTAQNDYNDLANQSLTLAQLAHPTGTKWIAKGATDPTLTINDDDELGQVTGVTAVQKTDAIGNLAAGATVSWTKVTNATGYVVEWKTGTQIYDSARRLVAGDVATYDIPGANLTPGTTYDIRVYATKSGSDHGLPSDEISAIYKGLLVFTPTSLTVDEPVTGTATGTYTVKLSAQPTASVTVNLSRGTGSSTTTPINPTFSPSTLTFSTTDWDTAQTVTVTVTKDTDGVDDVVVIRHAASSTGADYSGVTATLTATEIDNNQPPTSANFTHYVKAKSSANRTGMAVSAVFPYADPNSDVLSQVLIVTLPAAAQGQLKLVKKSTWGHTIMCRKINPNHPKCQDTVTDVTAGQRAPNDANQIIANKKVLAFAPTDSFSSATFTFQVIDWAGNISEDVYTATLLLEGSAPAALTNFAAVPGDLETEVDLSWDDPNDSSITRFDYRYQVRAIQGSWTSWGPVTTALTSSPASPTFTTTDWNTAQTVTVKLPAAPDADVKITLAAENVEFTPSSLTFTTLNWDTTQSVSVKLKTAPTEDETVDMSSGIWANATAHTVTGLTKDTSYEFQLRAENSGGRSPVSEAYATPVAPPAPVKPQGLSATGSATGIALSWTDPGDDSITEYELRQREQEGNLTAVPGDRQVTLYWDNPHSPLVQNYQYRYKVATGEYGNWTAMPTLPKNTSYVVTGLTNDLKHTFQVSLRDTSPAVTTKLIHTSHYARLDSNSKVTLTWNRYYPSHTYWQYRQKTGTGDYGAWTNIPSSHNQTTSWQTDALTTGTTYEFQVRPGGRNIVWSEWKFTAVSGATANVTWTNPVNDFINGHHIQSAVRTGANTVVSGFVPIPGSEATTTSYSATLDTGKFYTFRIRAVLGVSEVPLKTVGDYGYAVLDGNGKVTLSWKALSSSTNFRRWEYRYRAGAGNYTAWTTHNSDWQTSALQTPALAAGTSYSFEVRPVYWTTGAAPTSGTWNFTALAAGTTSKTITWNDPDDDYVSGYQVHRTVTSSARTLAASTVGKTTVTLAVGGHNAQWWYQANTGPHNTCQGPVAAGTATKDLTGLSAGTSYTYKAYSASGCASSNHLATAAFTTLSSISSLGSTRSGESLIDATETKQAVAFTTGSATGGYLLKSVTIPLKNNSGSGGLTVTLHAMHGGGSYGISSRPADAVLATLSGTAPTSSSYANTTWTCSGSGCNLAASKTYFIVVSRTGSANYGWNYANTESETLAPSGNGWNIGYEHYFSSGSWASWTNFNVAEFVFTSGSGDSSGGTGGLTTKTSWTRINGSNGATTSYTASGLSAGKFYIFQIRSMMKRRLDAAAATPSTTEGWTDIASSDKDTVSYDVPGTVRGVVYAFQVRAGQLVRRRPRIAVEPCSPPARTARRPHRNAGRHERDARVDGSQPRRPHHRQVAVPAGIRRTVDRLVHRQGRLGVLGNDVLHGDRADQRIAVHLRHPLRERDRKQPGLGHHNRSHAAGRPFEAGRLHRDGPGAGGQARLDRPERLQHHRLRVPADAARGRRYGVHRGQVYRDPLAQPQRYVDHHQVAVQG